MATGIDPDVASWCASQHPSLQLDAAALAAARRGHDMGDPRNEQHLVYGLVQHARVNLTRKFGFNTIDRDFRRNWPRQYLPLFQPIPPADIDDCVFYLILAGQKRFAKINIEERAVEHGMRWSADAHSMSLREWFTRDCLFNLPNLVKKRQGDARRCIEQVLPSEVLMWHIEEAVASDSGDDRLHSIYAFNQLLDTLPPRLRQVAVMLSQGATHEEIGQELGRSKSTVTDQVKQLRMRLSSTRGRQPQQQVRVCYPPQGMEEDNA